ncbi:MAG: enoyl-CoA hydratase [Desulfuromonas sp.]|nr:MAG: enoyl-CoA hydratase [Desulfuromonas sp.]
MKQRPELVDSTLTIEDRLAVLTMDRHDIRNALTGSALVDDIVATVDWIEHCEDISVLVLTGSGSAFSAGGNVKEMRDRQGIFSGSADEITNSYRNGIQKMSRAMSRLTVPAIAAVNGPAIGAGFDLACMCDMRIASSTATIGETFVNLGIIPGDGGAWFLQRLVGYQHAAELTFSGRLVPAEEGLSLGLFLDVVEPDHLMEKVLSLAREIASKPPLAVRKAKRLLSQARSSSLDELLEASAVYQGGLHHTRDHLEAIHALLEKRLGRYHGS